MKLRSLLPRNRELPGDFWIDGSDGTCIFGPVRCRGEADNSGAAAHGNVIEDPTKSYGDHPSGLYRIAKVVWDPTPPRSYGPCFMLLDPKDGEALKAKQNGRSGIGIHGGDLAGDGTLRVTFGCLRLDNDDAAAVGHLVEEGLAIGPIDYECLLKE